MAFHSMRKRNTSVEILKILQKEKAARTAELQQRLEALVAFKENHEELIFRTDTGNLVFDRLNRLSLALTEAQLELVDHRAAYETAKSLMDDPNGFDSFVIAERSAQAGGGADRLEMERLSAKLDDLEQRRADRLMELRPEHPAVVALDREIVKTRAEMHALNRRFAEAQLTRLEQAYRTAEQRVQELTRQVEQQHAEAVSLNRQIDQYTLLDAGYRQIQQQCELLDNRIRELNISEDVGALNITILEVARPSERPASPNRPRTLAVALIAGLALGCGGVLGIEAMNHRVRETEDVLALTGAGLLGVVTALPRRWTPTQRGQAVLLEPNAQGSEAFRTVRTAVYFGGDKERLRVLHVTSAQAGEGKSTLVSNLAITMAQSGQRVLVLDGDIRKPDQHELLEQPRTPGLTTVMAGRASLRDCLIATAVPRLTLLPSGPGVANPAELLGSRQFEAMLAKLRGHFDRILVDSSPLVPVTDASLLAAQCDATILVVRLGLTKRKIVARARATLKRVGAHLLGVVVVDDQRRGAEYGYGYGYVSPVRAGAQRAAQPADASPLAETTSSPSVGLPVSEGVA